MFPIGSYNRLVNDIKRRENQEIPITLGILIADCDQSLCREYILNYLNRFDESSGNLINFYIPGYIETFDNIGSYRISVKSKHYVFDRKQFDEFINKLRSDFSFEYLGNPTLLLMEYNRGHFSKSKKIEILLDSDGNDIKNTTRVFNHIFKIAEEYVDINKFKSELSKSYLKQNFYETLTDMIDNSIVSGLYKMFEGVNKYKFK